jgi:hypothetical protein
MLTLIYCVDVELCKYPWQLCISEIVLLQSSESSRGVSLFDGDDKSNAEYTCQ